MKFSRKQQRRIPLIAGSVVVVLIAVLGTTGLFSRADVYAWDICTRLAGGWHQPDPRVVLVAVDQSSIDFFADNGVLWPWPRDMWARLIEVASEAGAAGVVFDILFDDPGIERLNNPAMAADRLFAERLSGSFPAIICAFSTPGTASIADLPPNLSFRETDIPAYPLCDHTLVLPYSTFRSAHMGLSNIIADRDGVYRSMPLMFETAGYSLPVLGFKTVAMITGEVPEDVKLDLEGRLWLRFYGKGGQGGAFPYIPASALIMGQVPTDKIRGKILIVSSTAAGLLDYKPTPVADVEHPFTGFEIHATLISNLLQGDGLIPAPKAAILILALLIGFIGLAAFRFLKSIWQQILSLVVLTLIVSGLLLMLYNSGLLLPVTSPLLACYLGVGTQMYGGWRLEGRQRAKLHGLFSRYLDNNVIESMMDNPDELQMVGDKRRASILFTDMVGFTPMSEGLSPEEIVLVLNCYHEVVVEAILTNRGLLDKYVGDAVMAIFGAPLADAESQHNAAKALLEIHESVDKLTAERKAKGLPIVGVCIGVHTDEVVVGNIGHPRRMDYTAIGSGVNTASRLEGATRLLGTRNLVSETFCAGIPDSIHRRKIGRVVLKGLHEPLAVFELIPDAAYQPWVDDWAEAWRLWQAGKRREAYNMWEGMQTVLKEDKALPIMLQHLAGFVSSNKEDDDVNVFTSK